MIPWGLQPNAPGEDREVCDRWRSHGLRLVYAPDIVVYHQHALQPMSFCRQHFNHGRGAHYFRRARAQNAGQRLSLEPLMFYRRLLGYPFLALRGPRALTTAALLAMAQIATGFGFICEAITGTSIRSTEAAGRTGERAV